jgi:aminoglycoside phosphotransferase (APT) family kinase protein
VALVLQHGDPGIWNVMIDPAGRVTLLDWEAGEVDGLPLWDLFHFAGTYAHLDLGSLVPRSRLSRFGRHVFANSPLQSAQVAAVRTYIDELQLPAALVEPLFVMGFVHRAWKQSFRLSTAARARGYYRRVVALTLASRDAAGYRRLLRL